MTSLLTILHVLTCLFLMLTVLLQEGKGGGMGGAFGGGNANTVFGGSGASSFLQKITAGAGCIFMATSMILAFLASHNSSDALEKFGEQQSELARQKEAAKENAIKSQGSNGGSAAAVEQGSASVMMSTPAETPAPVGSAATPAGSAATPAGSAATPAGSAATGTTASPLNTSTGSATGAAGTPASTTQPANNSPTVPGTATVPTPGSPGTTTTKSNLGTTTTVPTATGASTTGTAPASAGPSGSSKDHAINPAKGAEANPANVKTGPSAGVTSPSSSAPKSAPATPSQAGLPEGKVGSAAPANSSPNAPK